MLRPFKAFFAETKRLIQSPCHRDIKYVVSTLVFTVKFFMASCKLLKKINQTPFSDYESFNTFSCTLPRYDLKDLTFNATLFHAHKMPCYPGFACLRCYAGSY